jgi:hypothetical protein
MVIESAVTPRREAIKHLAGAAATAVALTALDACASATSMTPATASTPRSGRKWDMSWTDRIKTRYRMAFDTNEVMGGTPLSWVAAYLSGAAEAYGSTKDVSTVLVLRHAAVPIALGDDIWQRMAFGETQKLKDPTTGEVARRNPFINFKVGDTHSPVGADATLDHLIANGTVVLACNSAFSGYVGMLAQKEKLNRDEARKQMLATMVPGVILMPNGIYAVGAAQDAGCGCLVVR